jgi:hypothetical protein
MVLCPELASNLAAHKYKVQPPQCCVFHHLSFFLEPIVQRLIVKAAQIFTGHTILFSF